MIDPLVTGIYLIFLQYSRAYIGQNSRFSKPVFEEKSKKFSSVYYNKIGFSKKLLKGTDWYQF